MLLCWLSPIPFPPDLWLCNNLGSLSSTAVYKELAMSCWML